MRKADPCRRYQLFGDFRSFRSPFPLGSGQRGLGQNARRASGIANLYLAAGNRASTEAYRDIAYGVAGGEHYKRAVGS